MRKLIAVAALAGALTACGAGTSSAPVRYTGTCGPANSLSSASADLIILSAQPARVASITVTWSSTLGRKMATVPVHRTIRPGGYVTVPIPLVTIKGYLADCKVTAISARASG